MSSANTKKTMLKKRKAPLTGASSTQQQQQQVTTQSTAAATVTKNGNSMISSTTQNSSVQPKPVAAASSNFVESSKNHEEKMQSISVIDLDTNTNNQINNINNHGSSSEDEGDGKDNKIKWKTLEHHGVTFFPAYTPHTANLFYKGKKIQVSPEVQEVCNWWAQCEETDFAKQDKVRENFLIEFKKLFDSSLQIEKLEDFDFTVIREHIEKQRELRNARSNEEKKKEIEERQLAEKKYKTCLFDQTIEKISNSMVEPPGIFRGRGAHPLAGKLKTRIVPEFVTINVGLDNPIPICNVPGHSWKRVVSNPEATWLSHFKDERNIWSNTKYVALAAESRIKGENDRKKYEKARKLKSSITKIRADYERKMRSNDRIDNQLGVSTYLIDKLALRVGNEKGEDEADTVGCCSLRIEHIRFEEDQTSITLDFLGKDSMRYLNTVQVDPMVYKLLKQFSTAGEPGDDIFDQINAGKLNDYLKEQMDNLSAKVFRTYNASITLQNELKGKVVTDVSPNDIKVKFYEDSNREVAILCNHQKSVSKNHDTMMDKMNDTIKQKQAKLRELEALRKKFKNGKNLPTPQQMTEQKLPKTLEQCQQKIVKLKESIEAENMKLRSKEDNKAIALGTSKINYMDPRITISWCKRLEVPIEKIFAKTLRNKFAWAMDTDPNYEF